MRLKAIPDDAIAFAEHNPVIVIGGGAAIFAGYLYWRHVAGTSSATVTANDTATTSDVAGALGYSAPIIYSNGTADTSAGGSATSAGSPISSAAATGIDPTTAALLAQKSVEDDYAHEEALFGLSNQLTLGAANAVVALAGIQSANYQIGAGLATSFLQSGSDVFAGNITGPDGSNFGFDLIDANGKKSTKNVINLVNSGVLNNPQLKGTANAGGASNTSYAGLLASTLGVPGGGSDYSSSVASSSASGGSSAVSPSFASVAPSVSSGGSARSGSRTRTYSE